MKKYIVSKRFWKDYFKPFLEKKKYRYDEVENLTEPENTIVNILVESQIMEDDINRFIKRPYLINKGVHLLWM